MRAQTRDGDNIVGTGGGGGETRVARSRCYQSCGAHTQPQAGGADTSHCALIQKQQQRSTEGVWEVHRRPQVVDVAWGQARKQAGQEEWGSCARPRPRVATQRQLGADCLERTAGSSDDRPPSAAVRTCPAGCGCAWGCCGGVATMRCTAAALRRPQRHGWREWTSPATAAADGLDRCGSGRRTTRSCRPQQAIRLLASAEWSE